MRGRKNRATECSCAAIQGESNARIGIIVALSVREISTTLEAKNSSFSCFQKYGRILGLFPGLPAVLKLPQRLDLAQLFKANRTRASSSS
jgi:hypothetical protein